MKEFEQKHRGRKAQDVGKQPFVEAPYFFGSPSEAKAMSTVETYHICPSAQAPQGSLGHSSSSPKGHSRPLPRQHCQACSGNHEHGWALETESDQSLGRRDMI